MNLLRVRRPLTAVRRVIAVCGAHPGAGAMHLGFAFATYLGEIHRHRTALVEIAAESRLIHMSEGEAVIRGPSVGYRFRSIDLYPGMDAGSAIRVAGGGYEEVIIVYRFRDEIPVFSTDVRRFVIGSARIWDRHYYRDLMKEHLSSGHVGETYLAVGPTDSEIRYFRREYGCELTAVPFIPNPFDLTKSAGKFISGLI